jgi:hypothetical protein
MDLIRKCDQEDEEAILNVINDSAKTYRGVIPEDRYRQQYMPLEELREEMNDMTFFGYQIAHLPIGYGTTSLDGETPGANLGKPSILAMRNPRTGTRQEAN